jgi:c-di-GMP-binding flagellar brake protein YcgR
LLLLLAGNNSRHDLSQRRGHSRYSLRLPISIRWSEDDRHKKEAVGYTRDISAGGVFVLSEYYPPVNTPVHCVVKLQHGNGHPQRLLAQGHVVRVESLSPSTQGFAVVADGVALCELRSKRKTGAGRRG